MHKPVVMIIDMLNDFFEDGYLAETRKELVSKINSLVRSARENQVPIIWVRQEFEPDLSDAFLIQRKENIPKTIRGTGGELILEDLNREVNDIEVVKKRYSAFYETNLDEILKDLDPSALVLAGINTHACVRMAAIDAYQRDYEVVTVRDCVSSPDQEHHEVTLRYMEGHISQIVDLKNLDLAAL